MASTAETLSNFIDGERVRRRGGHRTRAQPRHRRGARDARRCRAPRTSTAPSRRRGGRSTDGRRRRRRSAPRRCWRWPTSIEEHGDEIARLEALNAGKPIEAVKRRRAAGDVGQPALLRRRRPLPGGPGGGRVHGGLHLLHAPRAGRRDRPDHALELPADDGHLEDRPGAGGRQHGRAEAGRDDPDDDRAAGRAGGRRSSPRACSTCHRPRPARPARRCSSTPTWTWSSLTGSVDTGKHVARTAADTLKRVHLELGGKAPVVVFDDVSWRARWRRSPAPATTTPARTAPRPPACSPPSDVYDDVVSGLAEQARGLVVGDTLVARDDARAGQLRAPARAGGGLPRAPPEHAEVVTGGGRARPSRASSSSRPSWPACARTTR